MEQRHMPSNRLQTTMRKSLLGATFVLIACAASGALAQDRDHDRGGPPQANSRPGQARPGRGPGPGRPGRSRARRGSRFDGRYGHNHYYPSRGYVYGTLPMGAISVGYGSGNYFFHGGVWYRPYSGRYIVVQPPLGIYIKRCHRTTPPSGSRARPTTTPTTSTTTSRPAAAMSSSPRRRASTPCRPPRRPRPCRSRPIRSSIRATTRALRRPRPTGATATPGPPRSPRRWPTRRCSSAPPTPAWTAAATRCAERRRRASRHAKGPPSREALCVCAAGPHGRPGASLNASRDASRAAGGASPSRTARGIPSPSPGPGWRRSGAT